MAKIFKFMESILLGLIVTQVIFGIIVFIKHIIRGKK